MHFVKLNAAELNAKKLQDIYEILWGAAGSEEAAEGGPEWDSETIEQIAQILPRESAKSTQTFATKPATCSRCGTQYVNRYACANWDAYRQQWVMVSLLDQAYCQHCDADVEMRDIDPGKD